MGQRFAAGGGGRKLIAAALQQFVQGGEQARFVVDQQESETPVEYVIVKQAGQSDLQVGGRDT